MTCRITAVDLDRRKTTADDDDYCSRCTCWIWEALGWLPPNSRCADVAARRKTAEQAGEAL